MLATLREPPPVGSLREALLISLWLQKEQMEFAQTFAIIQTMVNKDKAKEALEDYRKARFPWIESSKNKQKAEDIKKLMEEIKRGALAIAPMASPKLRSRLKTRIVQRPANDVTTTKEQTQIYGKIGQMIPR
jgi:hypothetical protein